MDLLDKLSAMFDEDKKIEKKPMSERYKEAELDYMKGKTLDPHPKRSFSEGLQMFLDSLTGSDQIGLDPGEEAKGLYYKPEELEPFDAATGVAGGFVPKNKLKGKAREAIDALWTDNIRPKTVREGDSTLIRDFISNFDKEKADRAGRQTDALFTDKTKAKYLNKADIIKDVYISDIDQETAKRAARQKDALGAIDVSERRAPTLSPEELGDIGGHPEYRRLFNELVKEGETPEKAVERAYLLFKLRQ